jgi:uncharacterized protein (DUF488 family)
MEISTIGFTGWTAEDFFGALRRAGIRRLIDVRRHNTSQLAAFAKRDDLAFFLREILGVSYREEPVLAPTAELVDGYRKKRIAWPEYAAAYQRLLGERQAHRVLDRAFFDVGVVLLCSEHTAEHCHRRLAVEYLAAHWGDIVAVHL